MPGAILPPYAEPTGPELPRDQVIDSFIDGRRSGFSADLHIEGDTLLADRMFTFGARVGSRSILIRADVPQDLLELKEWLEEHLVSKGLSEIEPDARLGDIAAIQVTGIRGAAWDLWGEDSSVAMGDLERTVLGADGSPEAMTMSFSEQKEDSGIGMTLEELIGERDAGGQDTQE
ncbi:MAG: hypothetical protein ACR2FO_01665 [Actinomycetota bacterium]